MAQFFKFLLASCLGTALALGLLFFIGFATVVSMASSATESSTVTVKSNSILELKLDREIPEKTNNIELDPFDTQNPYILGLNDMVRSIQHAKEDPDIKGIYLSPLFILAGKASLSTLRAALEDFKTSGKFVVAYSNIYTQNAYYIASVADSILLNPVGSVEFKGYAANITFFKEMLDRLDVQMRIFYAGQFKSATEPFRLDKMSDQNRLQVREYLNALYDVFIADISRTRGIEGGTLRRIANEYGGWDAKLALQNRLIDRIAYEDEAFNLMKQKIGLESTEKLNKVSLADYYAAKKDNLLKQDGKDKIAVVYAEGEIMTGTDEPGVITDEQYVKILRKIRNDDRIKAIVLRINSPGGSVLASENIYREVQLCKQAGKAIVVSMGDYAASGGYYIACPADSIFCEAATLTGSIGVFAAVPILQKTMKEHLGITVDTVRTGKFSALGSVLIDFSAEESQIFQANVEATYEDFLQKVATGRRKTRDQVHEIAQGRVWSGQKAKEIGLVDDIGGTDRAIAAAANLAGLVKYRLAEYPSTKTGLEQFIEKFTDSKDRDEAIQATLLKTQLGELYPVFESVQHVRNLKGLQVRMPYILEIK
jgi:protease IV